ncbi:hypothetical protein DPMN_189431 [Dreissena polymorpha]|uniref:C1q domain-containing protein n=1 Tax=Dreissena polymorpha TaxID=45954 RepID=A0A9D4IAT7_DREPO|nr:hypothetical protein DPMN_189431 [Dreissena polymorpha]
MWTNCSATCGVGVRQKTRTCTNPKPDRSGNDCVGESSEYTVCPNKPCSVIGHAVAFNARGDNVLSNNVNAFPTVIFNEGNAYNANTGHFTAPVDGIYHFSTLMCVSGGNGISFYIEKGSATMSGVLRLSHSHNYNNINPSCTSESAYVKLTRNEHVWVLMDSHYTSQIWTSGYDSFTGMLIQEL